jgi:hypothetical protein
MNAIVNDALAALKVSLDSIEADTTGINKRAAVDLSTGQFRAYLKKRGIDPDTVDIRKIVPKEALVDSTVEKVDRTARQGERLTALIEKTAIDMNITKAQAADVVLLSPGISEYHRLEKELHAREEQQRLDKKFEAMEKLRGTTPKPTSDFPLRSPAWMNQRTNTDIEANRVETTNHDKTRPEGPGSVAKTITELADKYVKAGMTRAAAVEKASMHPEVIKMHQAEKARKMDDYASQHMAAEVRAKRHAA